MPTYPPPPVENELPKVLELPKEVELPKQIRPTAHLSGFECSKSVPTPLMKFATRHVSIPTSFGSTKEKPNVTSKKTNHDRNKNNLKIEVKQKEEVVDFVEVPIHKIHSEPVMAISVKNEQPKIENTLEMPNKLNDSKIKSPSLKKEIVLTKETKTQNEKSNSTSKLASKVTEEKQKPETEKEKDSTSIKSKSAEEKVDKEFKTKFSGNTIATTPSASNVTKLTYKNETISSKDQVQEDSESKSQNQLLESNQILERNQGTSKSGEPTIGTSFAEKSVREKETKSTKTVDVFPVVTQTTSKAAEPAVTQSALKTDKTAVEQITPKTVEPTVKQITPKVVEPTVKQIEPTVKTVEPTVKQITPNTAKPTVKTVEPSVKQLTLKSAESPSPRHLKSSSSGIFNFKEQPSATAAMHRTESFPRTKVEERKTNKLSQSTVSAPVVVGKTNLFSFPDSSHSLQRKQDSTLENVSLQRNKQTEPNSPKQLKAEVLPKIPELINSPEVKLVEEPLKVVMKENEPKPFEKLLSNIVEHKDETLKEETKISVSKDKEPEEEKSVEIECRSILTTNEEANLSRNQKTNVSPPKHVHFEQPTPPSTPTPPPTPASTPTSSSIKPFSSPTTTTTTTTKTTTTSLSTSSSATSRPPPRERKIRPAPSFQTVQSYQVKKYSNQRYLLGIRVGSTFTHCP